MSIVALASRLVKSFGPSRALDGLDLEVQRRGAWLPRTQRRRKTATIRIFLGLMRADAGIAQVFGADPWHDAVALHRRLAYVPGDVTLWPNLSGGEVIDLLGRLRGGIDPARRQNLLERFDLDPTLKGSAYSKGNRQKVALVAALASDVELLILDEPTSGLDPLMEAMFRECIVEERRRGRTVLLSSHILAEVEALCDRVTIIRNGRAVETGTMAELRHLTRTSLSAEMAHPVEGLAAMPGVHRSWTAPGFDARSTAASLTASSNGSPRLECEASSASRRLSKSCFCAIIRATQSRPAAAMNSLQGTAH